MDWDMHSLKSFILLLTKIKYKVYKRGNKICLENYCLTLCLHNFILLYTHLLFNSCETNADVRKLDRFYYILVAVVGVIAAQ